MSERIAVKHDDFDKAWRLFQKNSDFKEYSKLRSLSTEEQKYIVVTSLPYDVSETEKSKMVGFKYHQKPHRTMKEEHDSGEHDGMIFLLRKLWLELDKRPEPTKMDDLERLDLFIGSHDIRTADKLKAMELKEKLTKIQQGSRILAPWERIWLDVIIPNMVQGQEL